MTPTTRSRAASALALALAACSGDGASSPVRGPWNRPLAERERDPFPRILPRQDGTQVTIAAAPRRVVSGTILTDGVLLEICPRERIRALHQLSKDPLFSPVAKRSAEFPRHLNGDAEPMLAEVPDLVFVASFSLPETRARLAEAGVVVLRVDDFDTFADVASNLRMIGYALGLDAAAEGLVVAMEGQLAHLATKRAARAPWKVLLWSDGYTAGRGTLFHAMLEAIGAQNAAAQLTGHAPLNLERVLALDPDVLVVGALPGHEAAARTRLEQHPALAGLRAVKAQRVACIDAALLAATSDHAVLAARAIADKLDAWGKP